MNLEIIGYLESKTDKDNTWTDLSDMLTEISKSKVESGDSFESIINEMMMSISFLLEDRKIRLQPKSNSMEEYKIALEDNITFLRDEIKRNALEEMEFEEQVAAENEDYETAAWYRDKIEEYTNKKLE